MGIVQRVCPSARAGILYIYAVSACVLLLVTVAYMSYGKSPSAHILRAALRASYATRINSIFESAAKLHTKPWAKLATLADDFGSRLSGSQGLDDAIDWTAREMRADGLDSVELINVTVPVWRRGSRSASYASLISPRHADLAVMALGGSVPTPGPGEALEAEAVVVSSYGELRTMGAIGSADGKIVVLDAAWVSYDENYEYRSRAAVEAARVGAVAVLVRSLTPHSIYSVHTGGMHYEPGVVQIPAGAITTEDADMLRRMQDRGHVLSLALALNCSVGPPAPSANVVAELTGRTHPEQVVLLGAHIDAWDVGTGAMDDGGGVVAVWHALSLLHSLGLRPARTIRVVLFTNEENGLAGGQAYAEHYASELGNHVLAIESDSGVFDPRGFYAAGGSSETAAALSAVATLLSHPPTHVDARAMTSALETGADISPLLAAGVPTLELQADGGVYFDYHHTRADTADKIDPVELNRCIGVLAAMAYVVADMPETLPR
ncbi:peptidase M28D family protein [Thecamonas trahens ATCC 50062]|uniref:Carboxypeptidase Q n=1 Tax=Thecamonas trahens ATCC 50062 TaxID=461836 RepID=A0A0L0DSG6_THETB|nr:peptidase M28D family protein [Thecamonas trahens ATCC 50062]KNC55152.1 peptidase M28D family protein [Thecamonas trahens ATCC 50062]|eukprot:XP_013753207.1 peptidase M28D family protein [Thecamonas trahens ATCC 50062]